MRLGNLGSGHVRCNGDGHDQGAGTAELDLGNPELLDDVQV